MTSTLAMTTVLARDGHRLAVHQHTGSGLPILFLSGLWVPACSWQGVVDCLTDRTCVLLDTRGQGDSDPIPGHLAAVPMATHLQDALIALEACGGGPCHIVGLSLGGMVAIEVALARPQAVASLCVISCSADGELPEHLVPYGALVDVLEHDGWTPAMIDGILQLYLSPLAYAGTSSPGLRSQLSSYLGSVAPHSAAALGRGLFARPSRLRELHRLTMPVLSLIGLEDRTMVPSRQRATATALPDCTIEEFPGLSHPALEAPAATAASIRRHCLRVDTRTGR